MVDFGVNDHAFEGDEPPAPDPAPAPAPASASASEPAATGGAGTEKEEKKKEPKYADVFAWVDGFLVRVIRRRMNAQDGRGLAWDGCWWQYPEVFARLTALHQAWEGALAAKDPMAMSSWWIQHLEPHLRVIFDGDTGPMSHAAGSGSHPRLANVPASADVREQLLAGRN